MIIILCVVRRPWTVLQPTVYAEDGSNFYIDQLLAPSWSLLIKPFAGGYALPIPRVVALFASRISPGWAPYIFNGAGLLVYSLSCALFSLKRFRSILLSDAGRVVLCLLFALTLDSTELLASATNSFWILGLPVFLFVFKPPTAHRGLPRVLSLLGSMALAYSTPISVVAAPIAAFGLFRKGREGQRAWHIGLLTGAMAGLTIHLFMPGDPAERISVGAALAAFLVSLAQRVILPPVIGYLPTVHHLASSLLLPPLLALIGFTLLVSFLLFRGSESVRGRCLLTLYMLFGTLGESLGGRHFFEHFQQITGPAVLSGGPRYFYLASCAFAFLVALAAQEISSSKSTGRIAAFHKVTHPLTAVIVLAVFASGLYQNFRVNSGPYRPWRAYAGRIATWKRDRELWLGNSSSSIAIPPVVVPIEPPDMHVFLPGNALADGNFEDETLGPWIPFGTIDAAAVKSPHYDGQKSLALRGANGGVFNDLFFLHAGTELQVSAYAKTDPGGTGSALLWVTDFDKVQFADGPRPLQGPEWQKFSIQFTVSSTHRMRIHLMAKPGVVYWDHVGVSVK